MTTAVLPGARPILEIAMVAGVTFAVFLVFFRFFVGSLREICYFCTVFN